MAAGVAVKICMSNLYLCNTRYSVLCQPAEVSSLWSMEGCWDWTIFCKAAFAMGLIVPIHWYDSVSNCWGRNLGKQGSPEFFSSLEKESINSEHVLKQTQVEYMPEMKLWIWKSSSKHPENLVYLFVKYCSHKASPTLQTINLFSLWRCLAFTFSRQIYLLLLLHLSTVILLNCSYTLTFTALPEIMTDFKDWQMRPLVHSNFYFFRTIISRSTNPFLLSGDFLRWFPWPSMSHTPYACCLVIAYYHSFVIDYNISLHLTLASG